MADVTLRFTADGSELKSEVASDIKALQGFANAVDVTNKTAVSAFRESAAAQREQMQAIGASAQEYRQLDSVVKTFERDALAANSAVNLTGRGARTGGRAFAALAFDVDSATTSARGAVNAFGNLAYGISSTAKEGSFAAANAGGIFVLVTLLGVLAEKATIAYHAIMDLDLAGAVGTVSEAQAAQVKGLRTLAQVEAERARNQARLADAQAALTRGDTAGGEQVKQMLAYNNLLGERAIEIKDALGKKSDEAAKREEQRAASEAKTILGIEDKLAEEKELLAGKAQGILAQRTAAEMNAYKKELDAIDALKTVTTAERKGDAAQAAANHAARMQQIREEIAAVAARARAETTVNGGDPVSAYHAHLKLIEIEKAARIKAGWDVATAEEKAEQEVDALKQSYHDKEIAALGTIGDVMIASNNRAVHAIGEGFVAIRKIVMGYKAAENLIEGMKLTGQGLGLASLGDPGAAAAFAGAAEHFAASAVAAGEALSGAGGGGSRGGSGGGGSFNPKDSSRLGSGQGASGQALQRLEIVFVNRDQNDKELSRTRQRLDRLNDRNQPIRVAL